MGVAKRHSVTDTYDEDWEIINEDTFGCGPQLTVGRQITNVLVFFLL